MGFFAPLTADNVVDRLPPGHVSGNTDGPPRMIPGLSTQRAILFRSDTLVAAAFRFEAFPAGFRFTVHVEGNSFTNGQSHFIFSAGSGYSDPGALEKEKEPEDIFRVGIEFSDGTAGESVTDRNADCLPIYGNGESGAGGNGWGESIGRFWVPKLPSPGDFTIYAQWPALGISEHSATFDANDIIARAGEALPLLDSA